MSLALRRWLERNGKALQALAALVTAFAAVSALIGIKVQIDANMRQQQVQSARDIYREFLNISISKPEFADPDYCTIKDSKNAGAYENYIEYMLYTADQLLGVSQEWEATMMEHFTDHRDYLCSSKDWSDDSEEIRAIMLRFQNRQCKAFKTSCV